MRKPRSYAEVYNDLDGEIVNVFRMLQDPETAARLERLLRLTPFARAEFALAYQPTEEPIERARRTIIKAFMGFGSSAIHGRSRGMRTRVSVWRGPATGFRSNSNRSGTTPARDWSTWPDCVATFTERLAGVVIEQRDALEVMAQHDREECLHYVDPPYPRVTRSRLRKRKSEYLHELDDEGHARLAEAVRSLKGYALVSSYHCELYDRLYGDWPRVERASLADGARPRTEVLWLSPRTAAALEPELFGARA